MNKHDVTVIGLIIVVAIGALVVFANIGKTHQLNTVAEIYVNNALVATIDLNQAKTSPVPNLPALTYQVKPGSISIINANCPDQVCVKTGAISKKHQVIACIPNLLLIKIVPELTTKKNTNNLDKDLDGVVF